MLTSCISCCNLPKARTDIVDFFKNFKAAHGSDVTVVMEKLPLGSGLAGINPPTWAKLHANGGYLEGVIDTCGFQFYLIDPKKWQKAIGAGDKKAYGNRWKAHLKDIALRRFPYLGKSVTNNTADALLILAYVIDQQPRSNNDSP